MTTGTSGIFFVTWRSTSRPVRPGIRRSVTMTSPPLGFDARQSFPRVGEGEHVEAVPAQRGDDALEAVGVVVEDEDAPLLLLVHGRPPSGNASGRRPGNIARNCSSNGSATVIVVPCPSRLRT